VTTVFAGNYDDTYAKIKTSITAGNTPQLVQIYDLGTRFMIDSKKVTPVQNFIDQDKYNTDLEPIVANYFTINKKLYSMPWNNSMPILYYNKDAFTAAGLDPNKPRTARLLSTVLAPLSTAGFSSSSPPAPTWRCATTATAATRTPPSSCQIRRSWSR
jgi:sn-glycerol 3-phosphate transport system substrate-binding protein